MRVPTDRAGTSNRYADKLILGEPQGGASQRVRELADLFENAGIRTELSDNVRRAIWYKLWGNMTMNPLSALSGATADRLLNNDGLKPFILACMAEAAAVGAAIGCPISESGRIGWPAPRIRGVKDVDAADVERGEGSSWKRWSARHAKIALVCVRP